MRYLSVEEVLTIHDYVVQQFGGSPEILDWDRLHSSLETPRQTMWGEDLYPDLFAQAAILFYLLIKNHPFADGNKRTAVLVLIEFLERNGCTLTASNEELYDFTIAVATSKLGKEETTTWIKGHTMPVGPD